MMHTLVGGIPQHASQFYCPNPMVDEYARQLAISDSARRLSRASNGYRPANSMRVSKPSSASNSPQSLMARRRSMMNDSNMAKRRQYALDQAVYQQMQMAGSPYEPIQEPVQRPSRPVSWHPSTQMVQPQISMPQPVDFSQYILPTPTPYSEADLYASYQHMPPTPMAYSGQTSPISTFSPLSMPFASATHSAAPPQYVTADVWQVPAQFTPAACSPETEPFPSYNGQSAFNWDAGFVEPACHPSTTPPTPDNFQPVAQPEPVVPAEESIPYQPLEEPEEEEGEILIGMGLYDSPVKAETDPGLDHYKTTTSNLLGTTYRKGAGLKLEEAWEPPKESEDEEDEEAEGDDDDE